jgi:hypothetical protein
MIKLKIERYRDFTEEENKAREEGKKRNGYSISNYETLRPYEMDKYLENSLDIEITNEQFEAIRKAVLEVF